ncbi:hypothetical protein NQ314_005473 [Rhamnusium bicolor]|uniref:RRM domain-containing protein n=1 Tax=Rhamnusium bicolor TaxID=1586634 RepID=A0AAV8ZGZ8_9CUCU|nr:hypothetical protein NQ314_005473 [Rhamnusium bicolor]
MTEKSKDVEENNMQGLSVVDSLNAPADNIAPEVEEESDIFITEEEVRCLIKVEDDVDEATNNDESGRGKGIGESDCEITLKEADEEITVPEVVDNKMVKEIENKDNSQSILGSTLIITTEEHLDTTAFDDTTTNSEDTIVQPEKLPLKAIAKTGNNNGELNKKPVKLKSKKEEHSYFWVSNISRHVKATDLKKFFAQLGKVLTAKILTNGKSYFGYVSMDSAELAAKCINQLNNTFFDGRKIVVSKDRPDLRETRAPVKIEPRKKRSDKFEPRKVDNATEEKVATVEKVEPKEKRIVDQETAKSNTIIADLKRKLDRSKSEIGTLKWKLGEYQRRHDGMRKKCDSLERELKEIQFKMRNERRRLNQDREQFEKNKKLEQIRFEADKAIINKELDEVKKLREHLKLKIDELKTQTKKPVKRRSRSPVLRVRSPRGRSPILRNNNPNTGFRLDDRAEKKRKRDDVSRGRTPPPPPKLSSGAGKKRGDRGAENNAPNRPYFGEVDKRPSCHEYDYRHKSSYVQPQDPPRVPWQTPYPKDPRRLNPGPSASQNYPVDMRYGGGYQYPPSNIAGPPRSYYPEFGKPYGHF